MKTLLIICSILLTLTNSTRLRTTSPGQGNPELIRAFLEKVVDTKKNTKTAAYSSCVKLLCEGNDNINNRRQFTTYIIELANMKKPIKGDEIKAEFSNFENQVDMANEKGIVCGNYLKTIIKHDLELAKDMDKIYEVIDKHQGKVDDKEKKKENNFISNLATINRDSGLVDTSRLLKKLNGST